MIGRMLLSELHRHESHTSSQYGRHDSVNILDNVHVLQLHVRQFKACRHCRVNPDSTWIDCVHTQSCFESELNWCSANPHTTVCACVNFPKKTWKMSRIRISSITKR